MEPEEIKRLNDFKEQLCERGYEETVVFDNPSYLDAIVGITDDGRLVYDYGKMVEWLMGHDGMEWDGAAEFIDYNTIRALPYAGTNGPVVMYSDMLDLSYNEPCKPFKAYIGGKVSGLPVEERKRLFSEARERVHEQ